MMAEPDRLYIERDVDRQLYEALEVEFGKRSNRELFLFAMAFGVKSGRRQPLGARDDWFFAKDLRSEDRALMRAVAISSSSGEDVLLDEGQVFQIAEEYAHAGIVLLDSAIHGTGFGTFEKSFEKNLVDLFKAYVTVPVQEDASSEPE